MINPLQAETIFNHLYANINGYSVSNQARESSGINTEKLLYGELPFETCQKMIEFIKPKPESVFFDLGSGTGRVVLAFYLLFNFKKCVGVELLSGLHNKACEINSEFNKNASPQLAGYINNRELQFLRGDIFATDLREADLIFMNHPFKEGEGFNKLEEKFLAELKPGSKIITTIRALKNPLFKNLGSQTYKFSWGDSTAHFFEI